MNTLFQYLASRVIIAVGQGNEPDPRNLIYFALMIIVIGLVSIIYPKVFWNMRIGRKMPNVPPNNLYLLMLRLGGIMVIALGLLMISYVF